MAASIIPTHGDAAILDANSNNVNPVDGKAPKSTITAIEDDDNSDFVVDSADPDEDSLLRPGPKSWANCIGGQRCEPKDHRYPTSLADLIQAVSYASANKLQVRSVGAGHSFSDICPTNGMLLDFSRTPGSMSVMSRVLPIDSTTLKNPSQANDLFSVESGIKIRNLNTELNKRKKALATLGAYDGQTIAGAISTGTHGSMIQQGPIASLVRSLVLVSETGKVYQIEPTNGITDPSKFKPGPNNIELKQDDDWFQSAVIAMGCMGIIYSYTLEVVPAFLLEESRTVTTWQSVKTQIQAGLENDYYEIDINPYPTEVNGQNQNVAVEIVRTIRDPAKYQPRGSRGIVNWLAGLLARFPIFRKILVDKLNNHPEESPDIISKALRTLSDRNYVDWSYKVFDIGAVDLVKAYAVELSFDATQTSGIADVVDKVIAAFQSAAQNNIGYLAGPFALRFVKSADAYAAPQQGRFTMMVEMDMLLGITKGIPLLTHMKETLGADPSLAGMRVHWGLDLDTVKEGEVPATYSEWSKWLSVYQQLNTTGMWNNKFTDRVGISK